MDEMDVGRQKGLKGRIMLAHKILGAEDGGIDATDNTFKEIEITFGARHNHLPVPLVDIERMKIVKLLVGPDSVHVGVDAIARLNGILSQGEPFPLGKRVDHLCLSIAKILNGKRHGAFRAVEVVVYAKTFKHKQRCCYTAEAKLR